MAVTIHNLKAYSLPFKVYDSKGIYRAACSEVEAAAAVIVLYGTGSTIRLPGGKRIWYEGKDGEAGDSFDAVHEVAYRRLNGNT